MIMHLSEKGHKYRTMEMSEDNYDCWEYVDNIAETQKTLTIDKAIEWLLELGEIHDLEMENCPLL